MTLTWRTSSRCDGGACIEIAPRWRTSSHSAGAGECVEVGDGILVRDSTDRSGPVLAFTAGAWEAFTAALRAG